MEVYIGRQPNGPYQFDNSAMAWVLRLSKSIYNSGRNITCNNFFTSIPLLNKLESHHKLTVNGTIRQKKRENLNNSRKYEEEPKSPVYSGTEAIALLSLSYVPKKGKNVLLVSSMLDDA
ncbi:unnamed protein product [Parnassius mnemosyne]|uniref:PiggyBac transposable element-derived protein domain-containing protein n=1 Tax=Parnassius mnemosyne TaxID=213953 RepID=A0AAV1LM99_9NEOP